MTALLLPTWAGWVALTTWGLGFGIAGWMLGRWQGRRNAECRELHWIPASPNTDGLLGHVVVPPNHAVTDKLAETERFWLKARRCAQDMRRERDRYRLAWLSARRRAHDLEAWAAKNRERDESPMPYEGAWRDVGITRRRRS